MKFHFRRLDNIRIVGYHRSVSFWVGIGTGRGKKINIRRRCRIANPAVVAYVVGKSVLNHDGARSA